MVGDRCDLQRAPVSTQAALALTVLTPSDTHPQFVLIITGVFCLFGVMSLVSALLGMHAGSVYAGGGLIERYPQAVRVGTVVNGLMLLACVYGIYRRYLFARWAGFAVLLLGRAYSMVDLFTRGRLGNARMPAAPFGVASLIVVTFQTNGTEVVKPWPSAAAADMDNRQCLADQVQMSLHTRRATHADLPCLANPVSRSPAFPFMSLSVESIGARYSSTMTTDNTI